MNTLTGWLKKPVVVTLNGPEFIKPVRGMLVEFDDRWLTLQQGQQRLVVSVHNVLHVSFDPE